MNISDQKFQGHKKIFLALILISFTVFVFTADGHRYTIDEEYTQDQSKSIATLTPHPLYVQGESQLQFEYPKMFPPRLHPDRPICQNAFLCFPTHIGHTVTEVPFVFINNNFQIISQNTLILTEDDFDQLHYVFWRNNIDPDFVFLELFYGPIFSSLSVGIFFLIAKTFEFKTNTSIILTFVYGFATMVWAYSQTSLNVVPMIFFVLLGFLFLRKYQASNSIQNLILGSISLGFAYLTRPDSILFIAPLTIFFLFQLRGREKKITKFLFYVLPLVFSLILTLILRYLQDGTSLLTTFESTSGMITRVGTSQTPFYESIFGLILSPGVGLLIFAPILLTVFFSFPDFYKRNKHETILFLSFAVLFLLYYGTALDFWHGLNAWGSRYLLALTPFLLLPLGASLEQRSGNLIIPVVILAALGFFFNIVYVIQDVSWFVWSLPGWGMGLFGLCNIECPLYIHPVVIWTFENSQLSWSISEMINNLQPDIYLLKLFGNQIYGLLISILLIPQIYFFIRIIRRHQSLKIQT